MPPFYGQGVVSAPPGVPVMTPYGSVTPGPYGAVPSDPSGIPDSWWQRNFGGRPPAPGLPITGFASGPGGVPTSPFATPGARPGSFLPTSPTVLGPLSFDPLLPSPGGSPTPRGTIGSIPKAMDPGVAAGFGLDPATGLPLPGVTPTAPTPIAPPGMVAGTPPVAPDPGVDPTAPPNITPWSAAFDPVDYDPFGKRPFIAGGLYG